MIGLHFSLVHARRSISDGEPRPRCRRWSGLWRRTDPCGAALEDKRPSGPAFARLLSRAVLRRAPQAPSRITAGTAGTWSGDLRGPRRRGLGWADREPFGPYLGGTTAFDGLRPRKSSDYGEGGTGRVSARGSSGGTSSRRADRHGIVPETRPRWRFGDPILLCPGRGILGIGRIRPTSPGTSG